MSKMLFTDNEWTIARIENTMSAIEDIAQEMGYDYYEPQIEIITSNQMLNAYSSHALPIMYNHWSFGMDYIRQKKDFEEGRTGLAYEIIQNTNPCIAYCRENNTMTMQAVVLAHASIGHSAFFKNNYLFKQWTSPKAFHSYLQFAKGYIEECENRYGVTLVERFITACMSIENQSFFRYKHPRKRSKGAIKNKYRERQDMIDQNYNPLYGKKQELKKIDNDDIMYPCENLLYFFHKYAAGLEEWQQEICRIMYKMQQYFYPNYLTGMLNEGFACMAHYHIMTELHNRELIPDFAYLEFLHMHSNVVYPSRDRINIYELGFKCLMDIKRICVEPTPDDEKEYGHICNTNWLDTMFDICYNYRNDSFIQQYLTPNVLKDMKFMVLDRDDETSQWTYDSEQYDRYTVSEVHDSQGIDRIRSALAKHFNMDYMIPDLQITAWNQVDNTLEITLSIVEELQLDPFKLKLILGIIENEFWGNDVRMTIWDGETFHDVYENGEFIDEMAEFL